MLLILTKSQTEEIRIHPNQVLMLKEEAVARRKNIMANILGHPIGTETEIKEWEVQPVGLTMPLLHQEEYPTEAVWVVDHRLVEVHIVEKNHHLAVTTTGVNTLKFVLHPQQRGLEVMEDQEQVWEPIEIFVEEAVNMVALEHQDHHPLQTLHCHLGHHPKVVTVAVAITIIEAIETAKALCNCPY